MLSATLPRGREWIAARIPHAGRMCLLEAVLACDERVIRCETSTHRDPANPLRSAGRLGAACAIEYAAQAIALHGALHARGCDAEAAPATEKGMLVALREVTLYVATLHELPGPLAIACERLHGDAHTLLYRFTVSSGAARVAAGRATIVRGNPRGLET